MFTTYKEKMKRFAGYLRIILNGVNIQKQKIVRRICILKFYKCGQKWVIGVEGGVFENLISEPEALMCNIEPEPLMMWKTPLEKSNNPFKKESWEFSYVFCKFQGDNGTIYTLEVEKTRV
jgi:hypothetical protein